MKSAQDILNAKSLRSNEFAQKIEKLSKRKFEENQNSAESVLGEDDGYSEKSTKKETETQSSFAKFAARNRPDTERRRNLQRRFSGTLQVV